jgi:hypothetical protein
MGRHIFERWDSAVIAHVQGLSFNLIDRRNRAGLMACLGR